MQGYEVTTKALTQSVSAFVVVVKGMKSTLLIDLLLHWLFLCGVARTPAFFFVDPRCRRLCL